VGDEHIEFFETAGVEQNFETLASGPPYWLDIKGETLMTQNGSSTLI